jgi:predicted TIM-barrel fold metal-dependent hydrolase
MTMQRADAHIHLFHPGYADLLPANCRRIVPDELTLYTALAERHAITRALVVGYEGQPWALGNNEYLASLLEQHRWIAPTAYAHPAALTPAWLEQRRRQGFIGISLYLFEAADLAGLAAVPAAVWHWLEQHRWLLSVNARGAAWAAWLPILTRHPALRVLVSHLGLPPRRQVNAAVPADALGPVVALAAFPAVFVKLSGFYALSDPGHAYPHEAAWPYVATLVAAFGTRRLLWGSDYSPSLEWLSFAQTIDVLGQIPALGATDLPDIVGGTLCSLLDTVV